MTSDVMGPDPSDQTLIARARLGDALAFRALVQRFEPMIASVIIGMLGAGDEADDVGQETFIRFHAALHQFRGDAAVSTYLRRIAMNLSLNALTRRKRAVRRLVSRDASSTPLNEPVVDAIDLEHAERHAQVHHAVAQLGEKQRAVVVLRVLEGLSTNETAAALQLPAGTVMSRLARGMVDLKRLLAPYMQGASDAS